MPTPLTPAAPAPFEFTFVPEQRTLPVVRVDLANLTFTLVSSGATAQRLAIDYVMHYVKASGGTAPKVFKLREVDLAAGESLTIATRRSFEERTTRRHYPGRHRIDIQINGQVCGSVDFDLLGS